MKRPRLSDDIALIAKVERSLRPDYRAIANRAKVEADPRSTMAALLYLVQCRRPNSIKSNWQTFAAFDDEMVAVVFYNRCAKTQPEMEFRTVSLPAIK